MTEEKAGPLAWILFLGTIFGISHFFVSLLPEGSETLNNLIGWVLTEWPLLKAVLTGCVIVFILTLIQEFLNRATGRSN